MSINVTIGGESNSLIDLLIDRIKSKESEAKKSGTIKRKVQLTSYSQGLREALELLEAALRCEQTGASAYLRDSREIIKERAQRVGSDPFDEATGRLPDDIPDHREDA